MRVLSLPIDEKLFPISNSDTIDMSNLNFDIDEDLRIRACLIYLRNMNIPPEITFDFLSCSFEDKSKYLIEYLFGDINTNIPILNQSWIKILSIDYNKINIGCILDDAEIVEFINDNKDLIYEMHRLMSSFPLCSINYYFIMNNINQDTGFKKSSFNKFNIHNIINLFNYEEFLTLCTMINDITPVFYEKYFFFSKDFKSVKNPYIDPLIRYFPYIDLINILYNDNIKEKFIDELDNMLNGNVEGEYHDINN